MPYPDRPIAQQRAEFAGSARSGARLDPAVIAYIVEQYEAGKSLRQLAEATGRTHSAVRNVLDRAGVPRRPPGAPRLTDKEPER